MRKKTLSGLNVDIYEETLDNGLQIYICPLDRNNIHASIMTKFGNDITCFIPQDKKEFIEIPSGTAHFLEHKMFAKEEGPDPMTYFLEHGAMGNAYTSSKETRYHFEGPTDFFENLKMLLDCVTKPYFTEENIEKEQGIIEQETKAELDDVTTVGYYSNMLNMFTNHPHRYPVIGYTKGVKTLTSDILYDCYNTFYHPNNMAIVITGNIEPEKTIEFIKNYYSDRDYPNQNEIVIKNYDEPKEIGKKEEIINRDITNRIVTVSYKIPFEIDSMKAVTYISTYLNQKFGGFSDFHEETFKDKNIIGNIQEIMEPVDNFITLSFIAKVIEKKDIVSKIDNNLNSRDINRDDTELLVKDAIKGLILMVDNVENVADFIDNSIVEYKQVPYDIYDLYKNFNTEEYIEFISNVDFSNYTVTIIEPKA